MQMAKHFLSQLCSLDLAFTSCFSCHFSYRSRAVLFYFAFYSLCKPVHCWPHFSRPFQMQAALVAKASLASLTFRGVPVSEMNGLTRKCADNKERNGCVRQNTHTHIQDQNNTKARRLNKKSQNQNTMNAFSKTDKSLSKWIWSLMEK